MTFKVVDKTTGETPDYEALALSNGNKWLLECSIESFALTENGCLTLHDRCGHWEYVDLEKENLKAIFEGDN